jgi:hypothetical protein
MLSSTQPIAEVVEMEVEAAMAVEMEVDLPDLPTAL